MPDIEAFFEVSREIEFAARLPGVARRLLSRGPVVRFLQRQVDKRLPPGPSAEDRARGRGVIVAEAWDDSGRCATSVLETPEPCLLTARTAVEIARLAANGGAVPGYQTPSTVFGPDFIVGFDDVTRLDR